MMSHLKSLQDRISCFSKMSNYALCKRMMTFVRTDIIFLKKSSYDLLSSYDIKMENYVPQTLCSCNDRKCLIYMCNALFNLSLQAELTRDMHIFREGLLYFYFF